MSNQPFSVGRRGRRSFGRAQDSGADDPYRRPKKLAEPSRCRQCGAVFHRGRWTWSDAPEGSASVLCQACHRINDNYPAGTVIMTGGYLADPNRRSEILNLVRNQEIAEKSEHPHNRVIAIEETAEGLTVTTTDIHLPRRIAEAIRDAHQGTLDIHFDQDGYSIRAQWRRDA
jgi:NMD protein affecting ribosome stability and mRNA decay